MTDAIAVALVGGLPLTIAALGTLVVSLRNGGKADVIIGHVNSEKTAAEGRELTLRAENKLLRESLEESRQAAALLAQAVALSQAAVRVGNVAVSIPAATGKINQ
jgi:hypothetical protein